MASDRSTPREGVGHLWLVDPAERTLEVFERRAGQWVPIGHAKDDDPVGLPPFDAVTFGLAGLRPRGAADSPLHSNLGTRFGGALCKGCMGCEASDSSSRYETAALYSQAVSSSDRK